MTDLKIAIIGAGPAGLTLALLLLEAQLSINVTIFEAEADAHARTTGGTLDLHTDTGIAAMKRCGLFEEFNKRARYDGEAIVIANKHLRRYVNMGGAKQGSGRGRPEIDRKQLRDMLIEALPNGVIKWNHKLRSVDGTDDNLTLHFDNGVQKSFDLVIGADGTWSRIRPLLTPIKPYYAGICGVRFTVSNVAERHPDCHKLVNKGSVFAYSDSKAITAQQLGDGSLNVSTWRVMKEDWQKDIDFDLHDLEATKKAYLGYFADWAPELRKLIEVSDGDPWVANLYMLPVSHRWKSKGNVTLIGDAAHVFTPFAGEGVNLAMTDAMKLADAIIATAKSGLRDKLAPNIKTFEEDMFVRTRHMSQKTYDMMSCMYFEEGAPDINIEKYICVAARDALPLQTIIVPVFKILVYAYFWVFFRRFG